MTAIEVHRHAPTSIEGILQLAVEGGADIATLERLADLKIKVMAHDAKEAFTRALATFQTICPPIPRSTCSHN